MSQDATERTTTRKAEKSPPRLDRLPPFRLLLHNDDVNDFVHVITSVTELTPLSKRRSVEVTLEAHTRGLALLLVTHKERAELFQEQFKSRGLTTTIEPAE